MSITIGVDIGGSHVASAAINMDTFKIIKGSYFYSEVNNKADRNVILKKWASVINETLLYLGDSDNVKGVGFAVPGPFNYQKGIAMFEGNDKYEALYGVSITDSLPLLLIDNHLPLRFLNDASAFGVSSSLKGMALGHKKVLAITLGTGFGASFLYNQIPLISHEGVPKDGCLWDKPFKEGIADDYFSTRWFVNRYNALSVKEKVEGVKEIAYINTAISKQLFNDFSENLGCFLLPYIKDFNCELLIIGGSISKAHNLFLTNLNVYLKENNIDVEIIILDDTEKENIIGASYLFNDKFWEEIRFELPLI